MSSVDIKAELRAAIAKEHESAAEHAWATDEHYDIVNTFAPALLSRLEELESENAALRDAAQKALWDFDEIINPMMRGLGSHEFTLTPADLRLRRCPVPRLRSDLGGGDIMARGKGE